MHFKKHKYNQLFLKEYPQGVFTKIERRLVEPPLGHVSTRKSANITTAQPQGLHQKNIKIKIIYIFFGGFQKMFKFDKK